MSLAASSLSTWLEQANSLSQPRLGYRFGPENLLLPDLLLEQSRAHAEKLIDLGAGCGVLGLLASLTTGAEAWFVERNAELAAHLRDNLSNLQTGAHLVEGDLREAVLPVADLIIANPPFFRVGDGMRSKHETIRDATHSHHGDIEDFARVASAHLAPSGQFWLLYPTDRIGQVFDAAAGTGLHLTAVYNLHARHTGRSYRVWCRLERNPTPLRLVSLSVVTDR